MKKLRFNDCKKIYNEGKNMLQLQKFKHDNIHLYRKLHMENHYKKN